MKDPEQKITTMEYVVGFCSFIPLLGLAFGLASIVLGAVRFRVGGWKLMTLGIVGVFFTVVIYAAIFLTFFKNGAFKNDPAFSIMAKQNLRTTLMAVEFYKQAHGHYPGHLEDMIDKTNPYSRLSSIYDSGAGMSTGNQLQTFYYQLTPDKKHYYLLGVGPDGLPFTADDLNPDLTPAELAHAGYIKK